MSSTTFRTRHLALGSVVVVLAAGCATTSGSHTKVHTSNDPEQRFSMTGAGLQTSAVITRSGAQGPQVDVGRFDDGRSIRGTVDGKVIQMTVSSTHAEGIWGSGPITLDVDEQGDQLSFRGLVAGRPSNWTASAGAVQGTIGFCAYDLRWQNEAYAGGRSCAGGITSVTVRFPATIAEWEPINAGILMALLMATP